MAYVKVSTTRNAIAALRYGEHEESVVRGGVDCPADTETAIKLFKADRIMWNKDSGLHAHVLIQSFDSKECTPEKANKIGQELAQRVAPGHRAMVYSHRESEGGNIHNHIVICAVNQENGKKLDTHGMLWKSRDLSNELSREHGLSVIQYGREAGVFTKSAELRYTQAERGITDKSGESWKDNIRDIVDAGIKRRSLTEFTKHLKDHGITIRERGSKQEQGGKSWTYYTNYKGKQVRVRAAKLGKAYSRDSVIRSLSLGKLSALEKVQQLQEAGKVALEKANKLIDDRVKQIRKQEQAAKKAMLGGLIAKESEDTYVERFKNSGKTRLERQLEIEGRAE